MKNSNYTAVKFLLAQMSGQENTITIPRLYIEYLGSYPAAALLNQIIFWSDKSGRRDGFFFKSYADWEDELGLSEKQVRTAVTKMKALGFLETAVKKANGSPTLHYKLDFEALCGALLTFGQERNLPKGSMEPDQKAVSLAPDQRAETLTVDYTEEHLQKNTDSREGPPPQAADKEIKIKTASLQDVSFAYQRFITHNIGPFTLDTWKGWEKDAAGRLELVVYAIERTAERVANQSVRSKENFVGMLLRSWAKENVQDRAAAEAYENKPKGASQSQPAGNKYMQFAKGE